VSGPKTITDRQFHKALVDAGVIRADEWYRRIVIDVQIDSVVVMYLERFGDDRMLQVIQTLEGVEIRGVPSK
jgi:hypothetical protein